MPPTWTPEHVVDQEQAERLIREQFPELAPLRLETVGEGYDNTVYRVNEAYTFLLPAPGHRCCFAAERVRGAPCVNSPRLAS